MKKDEKEFLKSLIETPSPSGFERSVAKIWREFTKKFADRVYGDLHGNSFAVLNPQGKPKVMLAGHCDEVGLMINYIDDNGFLFFRPIGGLDRHILPASRVRIWTKKGPILGVIGKKAIHVMPPEEREKVSKFENMWIDIGVTSKKEAEKLISIGDVATMDVHFEEMTTKMMVGRGFDDRIGAYTIAQALRIISMRKTLKTSVTAVATVQEEIGLRGATTSAYSVNPDIGIAVDVTFASDHPDLDKRLLGDIKMGKGPVVDRGANINPKLFDLIVKTAKQKKIPIQISAAPRGTGTDANVIQLTRGGVATALISIPNRYMHTPVELVHSSDVDNTALLIAEVVTNIKSKDQFML